MKRVGASRKLFGVKEDVTLKELKALYRNQMKATHPDKFVNDEEGRVVAEEKSKEVIEAYHFLTSIHPETHEANEDEFMDTTTNSGIKDFYYKKRVLFITHENGINYEYLGVPENVYAKMVNSDSVSRFAKRQVYGKFLFRKASKATEA